MMCVPRWSLVALSATLAAILAGAAPGAAADPACDDFERAALGPDWIVSIGSKAAIVNASDLGVPDTNWCFVIYAASPFAADQWSRTVLSADKPANLLTQVFVRRRNSDYARYGFHWNGDPGNSQWEIKYDGVPTPQTRRLAIVPGGGPAPGDSICIEIEGATIRGYHNGSLVATATDTASDAILQAGPPGVVARNAMTTSNTPPTPIFESWQGGSLPAGGACERAGVILYAARRGNDVELVWAAPPVPYQVERALGMRPPVFGAAATCATPPTWRDPAVVDDGRLLFYRIAS